VPDKPEVFKNIDYRTLDLNTDLTYHEVPLLFCKKLFVSHEEERSSFARSSGVITQRRKPLGNERINFERTSPHFSVLSH
jgi:hypothetical protein